MNIDNTTLVIIVGLLILFICFIDKYENFTNCSELCSLSDEAPEKYMIDCPNPETPNPEIPNQATIHARAIAQETDGHFTWENKSIDYSVPVYGVPQNTWYDLSRVVDYYYLPSNNKTLIYFGGTYEGDPIYNNIFCGLREADELYNGTDYGGYYHRNKMIKLLIENGYNIIRMPQISPAEVDILSQNIPADCNYQNNYDEYYFWYVYNDISPNYTPQVEGAESPPNLNLSERYNYDFCGNRKIGSPDKHFFNAFFSNSDIIQKFKNTDLYVGGYSGGGYMTGRILFETVKRELTWVDNKPIIFKGAFILSGAPYYCISPWELDNQWCPMINADTNEFFRYTKHENADPSYKMLMNELTLIDKDIWTSEDLSKFPPVLFLSPQNDDTVRRDQVEYYWRLLNKYNPLTTIIQVLEHTYKNLDENTQINTEDNQLEHQFYGPSRIKVNMADAVLNSAGIENDIFNFFRRIN